MKKVCHLTTVHQPFDIRIFRKECRSLARAGYDTHLIAVHDRDETVDGVRVLGLPKPRNRQERWRTTTENCLKRALDLRCDLYQFHDPELIPVGLKLKAEGHKVVYDVHESHAESILDRDYLHPLVRRPMSWNLARLERQADKCLDAIVAATPKIARQFRNAKTTLVQNYPELGELSPASPRPMAERQRAVCYVGGVSVIRGAMAMIGGVGEAEGVRLKIVGEFNPSSLPKDIAKLGVGDWTRVDTLGWLDRVGVAQVMEQCVAGMLLYLPLRNHIESQPNKLFEYMSAGLPVVCSNFPHWRDIVEKEQCGILVEPTMTDEIGEAVKKLADDRNLAERMGQNGKRAVETTYNWSTQEKLLLDLYAALLA